MTEVEASTDWVCPKCQTKNSAVATTCIMCGERCAQYKTAAQTMPCPHCGMRVTGVEQFSKTAVLCNACKAPLFPQQFQGAVACPECGKRNTYAPTTIAPAVATCGVCKKPLFPKLYAKLTPRQREKRVLFLGYGFLAALALVFAFLVASDKVLDAYRVYLSGYRWLVYIVIWVFLLDSLKALLEKEALTGVYHALVSLAVGIWSFAWALPKMTIIKSGMFQLGVSADTFMGGHSGQDFVRLVQFHYYVGLALIIASALMITAGVIINALAGEKTAQ